MRIISLMGNLWRKSSSLYPSLMNRKAIVAIVLLGAAVQSRAQQTPPGTADFRNCRFGPGVSFSQTSFAAGRVNFDGSLFECAGQLRGWPFPQCRFAGASEAAS